MAKKTSWGEAHFPGRLKFKQFHSGCQRQHSIFSKIYKLLYSFQFDFSPFTRVSPPPLAHITMLQLAQLLKVLKIEASPVSINHSNTGTWVFCCCCWFSFFSFLFFFFFWGGAILACVHGVRFEVSFIGTASIGTSSVYLLRPSFPTTYGRAQLIRVSSSCQHRSEFVWKSAIDDVTMTNVTTALELGKFIGCRHPKITVGCRGCRTGCTAWRRLLTFPYFLWLRLQAQVGSDQKRVVSIIYVYGIVHMRIVLPWKGVSNVAFCISSPRQINKYIDKHCSPKIWIIQGIQV